MLVNSLHSLDLTSRQLIHPALTPLIRGGQDSSQSPPSQGGFRGIWTRLQATFIMGFSLKLTR